VRGKERDLINGKNSADRGGPEDSLQSEKGQVTQKRVMSVERTKTVEAR